MTYRVFVRTWWTPNASWPDGREPQMGRKFTLPGYRRVPTIEQARAICQEWNRTHHPGPMSRRAEFEEN